MILRQYETVAARKSNSRKSRKVISTCTTVIPTVVNQSQAHDLSHFVSADMRPLITVLTIRLNGTVVVRAVVSRPASQTIYQREYFLLTIGIYLQNCIKNIWL